MGDTQDREVPSPYPYPYSVGVTAADFENVCSDRLIDAVVAWDSENKIKELIDAQLAASANHVCLMPTRWRVAT
jgi:hypothetical protein